MSRFDFSIEKKNRVKKKSKKRFFLVKLAGLYTGYYSVYWSRAEYQRGVIVITQNLTFNALKKDTPLGRGIHKLAEAGFTVIQTQSNREYFATQPTSEFKGMRYAACKPVTTFKYFYDRFYYYDDSDDDSDDVCGFCIIGGDAGATGGIGYGLSNYNRTWEWDGVFAFPGIPFARIDLGCVPTGSSMYAFESGKSAIDGSYGFLPPNLGPCALNNASWYPTFQNDSVDGPGASLSYETYVYQLTVGSDTDGARFHGSLLLQDLMNGRDGQTSSIWQGMQTIDAEDSYSLFSSDAAVTLLVDVVKTLKEIGYSSY